MFQHGSQRQEGAISVLSHQDPLIACPTLASTKQNKCAENQNKPLQTKSNQDSFLGKRDTGDCHSSGRKKKKLIYLCVN